MIDATRAATAVLLLGLGLSAPCMAQGHQPPPIRALDFDLWCSEEQHYPYERCAKRQDEDMQAFEHYRDIIEKYENQDRLQKKPAIQMQSLFSDKAATPGAADADVQNDAK